MISVCMATYNGEKFLNEQLSSILAQLEANDEFIIIDDCSTDSTYEILSNINDDRLKIFCNNTNEGHIKAFERSIALSSGDYIFLSDQDDIWIDGRLQLMLRELSSKSFVASNYSLIDTLGSPLQNSSTVPLMDISSDKWLKNIYSIIIGRANYYGCAFAFDKSLKSIVLPFPPYIEAHDLWIATAANLIHSVKHIETPTLLRRIHGNNFSVVVRPFFKKIKSRVYLIKSIFSLIYRVANVNR